VNPIDELIEALTIFKKYLPAAASPTHCEHDELMVMVTTEDTLAPEDEKRLEELGFHKDFGMGLWTSTKFGSA
jgi:hypothetical protein